MKGIELTFNIRLNELVDTAKRLKSISVQQIAEECGICYTTFRAILSGRTMPTCRNLKFIADYFGVSSDYLLGREGYFLEEKT